MSEQKPKQYRDLFSLCVCVRAHVCKWVGVLYVCVCVNGMFVTVEVYKVSHALLSLCVGDVVV